MLLELNQSLSRNRCPVEHVVVVDGNPEETITEELAGLATVIRSPRPIGQAEARNLGLEAAKGGWVTSADDNDWLHAYSIDRLLEAISGQMTKTSWFYDLELLARRCCTLRPGMGSHYFVQNTIDQGSSNNVASKNNDNTFVSLRKRTLLPSQCRFR
jgi:glycosyltransferase involved in cell wall biosynthesis